MAKSVKLKTAIWLCWMLGLTSYSAIVYAAEHVAAARGLDTIPFEELPYVWPVILVGGCLGVLTKMANVNRPAFRNDALEISKDLFGSLAGGGVMFLMGSWVDMSIYSLDIKVRFTAIFFASYGGARFVEIVYREGFMNYLKRMIDKWTGAAKEAPQQVPPPVPPVNREESPQ